MKDKEKKMLFGIGIVFLFLASVGFSYAYFKSTIVNKDVKDQIVTTGTLSLRYVDGPEINMQNIKPGSTITKTVYVANTGTLDASYNLVWQELINEITNDEMVIEVKCTRMNGQTEEVDGTCEGLTETPIKKIRIKDNVSIEPSIVHKYDITITFKEMNKDQNYNQNKKFSGVLGVKEYKAPETIYCTFDGELTQGIEYVNGQYTYRYMQEYGADPTTENLAWLNISNDGWGVKLTDETSTDPIAGNVCTYINNKPVVSMLFMFADSQATTLDVSNFNTSNVTDMSGMFAGSQATTLDVSSFDTSKVTNMSGMFYNSKASSIDLSSFNTSKVTNMSNMFGLSQVTILDLSNFDTSNVTNMNHMFGVSKATVLDLKSFDTSKVTDMHDMFRESHATTLDLSNFDTSNVTDMGSMFKKSQVITLDLSSFDTSNVSNMSWMFAGSQATIIDVSKFNTSNVTDMGAMFADSQATILDVSKFDTSSVTSMGSMFSGSKATILDVSKFDTSNVTNMNSMFYRSKSILINLESFDTSKVTDMKSMFEGCKNLKTIYVSNKFATANVTNSTSMFTNSTSLVGGAGTVYDSTKVDKTYARIDGGTDNPGYFTLKN